MNDMYFRKIRDFFLIHSTVHGGFSHNRGTVGTHQCLKNVRQSFEYRMANGLYFPNPGMSPVQQDSCTESYQQDLFQ